MIGSAGPMTRQAATNSTARPGDAHHHVRPVGIARALQQVLVEEPLIEPDREAQKPQPPGGQAMAPRPAGRHQRQGQQHEEADMERAHDQARQSEQMGGGGDLEDGEGDGDGEEKPAFSVLSEMGRQRAGLARFADGGSADLQLFQESSPGNANAARSSARLSRPFAGRAPRARPFPCSTSRRRDGSGSACPWPRPPA